MSHLIGGVNYCWQGRSVGKFKQILTLYDRKKTVQWGEFEKATIHQDNLAEVKACSIGGKTRRRRRQRKTRRH